MAFFAKKSKDELELAKRQAQRILKEDIIEVEDPQNRQKSDYAGVPKPDKILSTDVRVTKSGFHVFHDGRI